MVHYIHVLNYDTEAHKYVQLLLPFQKNEIDKFTVNLFVKLVMKFSLFLTQIRNKSIKKICIFLGLLMSVTNFGSVLWHATIILSVCITDKGPFYAKHRANDGMLYYTVYCGSKDYKTIRRKKNIAPMESSRVLKRYAMLKFHSSFHVVTVIANIWQTYTYTLKNTI